MLDLPRSNKMKTGVRLVSIVPYAKAIRKWNEKKNDAALVADKMGKIRVIMHEWQSAEEAKAYWIQRGSRMAECANRIEYTYCLECGSMHIAKTNLCRDRLCPVCSWRLSLQRIGEMMHALEWLYARDKAINGAMLTLTMRNVEIGCLNDAITSLLDGWSKLRKRRAFQRWVIGYARSLEITRGNNTWHPHLHILLLFRPEYDKQISQKDFASMWRECLGVDYTPICDIRRSYKRGKTASEDSWSKSIETVLEATKYAIEGKITKAATPDELAEIAIAVHGRRLISYGMALSEARAALGIADNDAPEDISDMDISCPKCGSMETVAIAFLWAQNSYLLAPIPSCFD